MSLEKEQSCIVRQNNMYYEHRDSQATAMSVDWSGQWVLLAGRRHLALQRLQDDEYGTRKFNRNSKYDVSAAEWSLCKNSQEYCAIATSQLIEVVTWSSGDPTLIYSLRAHTRMVTDIDWHSREPHLLASCSIDTFTHLWDLSDPRKPTLSLSAVCMSGATQVGFNRVSGHLLATAHDGDLRIWDIRKGSCPIQYITAHSSRIHGINWSHTQETCLTTASQDGTVKYFDVNNPKRAEKIITTSSPVWRARFTPVGNGLVTVVVPHLGRGENSLMLWSNNKQTEPVCSFVGHTDVILDFAWRPNREDENSRELELITWARDQTLRLWKIDETLLQQCEPTNYDNILDDVALKSSDSKQNLTDYHQQQHQASVISDNNDWLAKSIDHPPSCSLQHEFSLLNTNIPHIDVEVLDSVKRFAEFKIVVSQYTVILQVNFPLEYPKPNVYPEFDFCEGTTLDEHIAISVTKILKSNALQRVKRGKTCLEQCLRALVNSLKKSIGSGGGTSSSMRLQSPRLEGALTGALHDACVPFPRTSGVSFSKVGYLVHFSQNFLTKRISLRHQNTTPRALSAISGGFLGNVMGTQPVLYAHREKNSSYYLQDRLGAKSLSKNSKRSQSSSLSIIVNIYDMQKILNISKETALQYKLEKNNIIETCRHNMKYSEEIGRLDLVLIWKLAESIATSNTPIDSDYEMLFYNDPFKKFILESLIMHFAKHGDIQTAAMLCCIFEKFNRYMDNSQQILGIKDGTTLKKISKSPNESPYHTILPMDSTLSNQNHHLSMQLKQYRSNSWSDSLYLVNDMKNFSTSTNDDDSLSCINSRTNSFLSKSKMLFFDALKKSYGEILFAWGLLTEKTLVLKHLSYPQQSQPQCIEFAIQCCNRVCKSPVCSLCHKTVMACTLCLLPVKGSANACLACGHGGHSIHMDQWFKTHDYCPSGGCDCLCIEETSALLKYIG